MNSKTRSKLSFSDGALAPEVAGGLAPGTEQSLKLWVVLNRAFEAMADVARESVASHGLTPGEFGVLEALYHKGPLLLRDVRRKILVSSGGATYLVDRLQGKGLVRRRACAEDRRATYAELTEEGRKRIEEVFPAHAERLHVALAGLEPEEKRAAIGLLKKLGYHAARERREEG